MARIPREEVERIAELARLLLDPEEAERMSGELERILEYVETLQEVATEGIEPTSHAIPIEAPLRDDEPVAGLDPERALACAPQREGSAFVVPKVIAEDEF